MAGRRTYGSYNDGCAAAHALDVVGDRWTMIVVRELLLGPKRFTQLQRDVVGIGPSVLAQRLHELEQHGVLTREHLPAPADVDVYALTAWGQRLEAVNTALSQWAVGSPTLPWDADMSPDTLVLAMRALLPNDSAGTDAGSARPIDEAKSVQAHYEPEARAVSNWRHEAMDALEPKPVVAMAALEVGKRGGSSFRAGKPMGKDGKGCRTLRHVCGVAILIRRTVRRCVCCRNIFEQHVSQGSTPGIRRIGRK